MKLIKLECDNPLFKPIIFNSGLSIIAGIKLSDSEKKTFNGIGKSASLSLVHLMLGSKISKDHLIDYLANYGIFTLIFSHLGNDYKVNKNFGDEYYIINNEKLKYSGYISRLNTIFTEGVVDLSFRQIFNVFARRFGYYEDALTQQRMGITDYYQRLVNLTLLGVDTDLVKQRQKTKDQISKLEDAKKIVSEYEKTIGETNLIDLKEELVELIKKKDSFIIARNYDEQKQKADLITNEMNELRDSIYDLESELRRKNNALEESVYYEIDNKKVKAIYEEANFFFPELVYKRLEEVQEFHNTIVNNRRKRLAKEIEALNAKIKIGSIELDKKETKRDKIIESLEKKGALEEYYGLLEQIKDIEDQINEMEKYKSVITSFKKDKSHLEVVDSEIKEKSIIYINDTQDSFEEKESIFRSIVKRFYTNSGGVLELRETEDAKYLYDIVIQIPKDSSQGINEVKIFCYDVLLFILNNKLLGFMAHDGCIFSEMDPRQQAAIIKTVLYLIEKYELQYFVNMNQNTFDEIIKSPILSDQEKKVVKEAIILNLNDKNPDGWLFGESF